TTAASHSLAQEAGDLAGLIGQFQVNGTAGAVPAGEAPGRLVQPGAGKANPPPPAPQSGPARGGAGAAARGGRPAARRWGGVWRGGRSGGERLAGLLKATELQMSNCLGPDFEQGPKPLGRTSWFA